MESLNLTIFICLAIPLSMTLLMFKGHSRMLCAFLLSGMFMCVFSGEINGLVLNVSGYDTQFLAVNIAPLVEEITKALPIIFIAFLVKPSRQKIAEFALMVGVGFATLENISLLVDSGSISLGYAFLRAIGAGMMHGICTLVVGLAMFSVIEEKMVFFSGTISALSIAMIYHSIYNMLITSKYMVLGALLPIVTFTLIMIVSVTHFRKVSVQKNKNISKNS